MHASLSRAARPLTCTALFPWRPRRTVRWPLLGAAGLPASVCAIAAPIVPSLALLLLGAAAAGAHEYEAGEIDIDHPYVPAPPPGAPSVAGYLTLANTGDTDDVLIGASADFAERVEVHTTVMDGDVARMRELESGVELPAGTTVGLVPNRTHLMFVGPRPGIVVGDALPATLHFEVAGDVEVVFDVEDGAVLGGDAMDHGDHVMGDDASHGMEQAWTRHGARGGARELSGGGVPREGRPARSGPGRAAVYISEGRNVTIPGTCTISTSASSISRKNGSAAREIARMSLPVSDCSTKRLKPTGGVICDISTTITM